MSIVAGMGVLSMSASALALTVFDYDLIVAVYQDLLNGKRSTKWFRNVMLGVGTLIVALMLTYSGLILSYNVPSSELKLRPSVVLALTPIGFTIDALNVMLALLLFGFSVTVLKILRDSNTLGDFRAAVYRFVAAASIIAGCAGEYAFPVSKLSGTQFVTCK